MFVIGEQQVNFDNNFVYFLFIIIMIIIIGYLFPASTRTKINRVIK